MLYSNMTLYPFPSNCFGKKSSSLNPRPSFFPMGVNSNKFIANFNMIKNFSHLVIIMPCKDSHHMKLIINHLWMKIRFSSSCQWKCTLRKGRCSSNRSHDRKQLHHYRCILIPIIHSFGMIKILLHHFNYILSTKWIRIIWMLLQSCKMSFRSKVIAFYIG